MKGLWSFVLGYGEVHAVNDHLSRPLPHLSSTINQVYQIKRRLHPTQCVPDYLSLVLLIYIEIEHCNTKVVYVPSYAVLPQRLCRLIIQN